MTRTCARTCGTCTRRDLPTKGVSRRVVGLHGAGDVIRGVVSVVGATVSRACDGSNIDAFITGVRECVSHRERHDRVVTGFCSERAHGFRDTHNQRVQRKRRSQTNGPDAHAPLTGKGVEHECVCVLMCYYTL